MAEDNYGKVETVDKTPFVATEHQNSDGNNYTHKSDTIYDDNDFSLPQWGYDNFILERANFQKSVTSLFQEPAFYYFKLFFKFNTGYGLLGPIGYNNKANTENGEEIISPQNSALNYLWNLDTNMSNYYGNSDLNKRYNALKSFINILSYINTSAPWFFKSIKGLDKIEDFTELKTDDNIIEISCLQDAIDMRLETLLGLYRYACYDTYHQREIIPENLRMFDMAIMVFQTPIRYYQTAVISRSKKAKFKYKSISGENTGNKMSYKIIFFKNCEILQDTFKTILPGDLTNERPSMLENISIKIQYQKALVYNYNEFMNLFYGDISNNDNLNPINTMDLNRFEAIKSNLSKLYYYNPYSTEYKDLIDISEAVMTDGMRMVLPEFCMGNIYGTKYGVKSKFFEKKMKLLKEGSIKSGNLYGDSTDVNSDYYKAKLNYLKSKSVLGNLYGDTTNINKNYYKAKLKELKERSIKGNLYGSATSIKKQYFLAKLKELKERNDKVIGGNLYGNTTNTLGEYYKKKLEYFNEHYEDIEEKKKSQLSLEIKDSYDRDAKRNNEYYYPNDYSNLIETDDIKNIKELYTKNSPNRHKDVESWYRHNALVNGLQYTEKDFKSLIHERNINIKEEEKKTFWNMLKDIFYGGGDSLVDSVKNFNLESMLKF